MKVYNYHPDTGEFVGESKAKRDPLEKEERYLIPANATIVEPPKVPGRHVAVFNGAYWDLPEDWRGFEYWDAEGLHYVIDEIGVLPPAGHLIEPPVPPELTDDEKTVSISVTAYKELTKAKTFAEFIATFKKELTP